MIRRGFYGSKPQQRGQGGTGGGATRHPRAKGTRVEGREERQEDQRLSSELMAKHYFLRVRQVVEDIAGGVAGQLRVEAATAKRPGTPLGLGLRYEATGRGRWATCAGG